MKNLTYLIFIMAISCKPDQPILFPDDFCESCSSDYCTPVEFGDTSTVQVDLTELTDNLITNGTFASDAGWTIGTDWAISGGTANYSGAMPGSSLSRDCDVTLQEGYYLVKLDIIILETGVIDLSVSLGGVAISQIGGLVVTSPFVSQTLYLFAYITPSDNSISISGAIYDCSIDNVEVYRLSSVAFDIKDCDSDTTFYSESDGSSVEYFETGDILGGNDVPAVTTGYGIITLDWDQMDLDEGCYCLCVKDGGLIGINYIENGGFDTSDDWTIVNTAAGWTIGSGVASHVNLGGAGNDTLSQTLTNPLDKNLCYNLSIDVIASGSWAFDIKTDSLTESLTNSMSGSGNQTVSLQISLPDFNIQNDLTDIHIIAGNAVTGLFDIDNLSIYPAIECLPCTTSNCISLRESWDAYAQSKKMCNLLLTGTSTNSAFGFAAGYSFSGRVFGQIRNGTGRDMETTHYRDLSGLTSNQYSERTKVKELQLYQVPQGAHDWIEIALNSETVTIENNGVTKEIVMQPGDYTPNWRRTSAEAPVIVEIAEVQQKPAFAKNV